MSQLTAAKCSTAGTRASDDASRPVDPYTPQDGVTASERPEASGNCAVAQADACCRIPPGGERGEGGGGHGASGPGTHAMPAWQRPGRKQASRQQGAPPVVRINPAPCPRETSSPASSHNDKLVQGRPTGAASRRPASGTDGPRSGSAHPQACGKVGAGPADSGSSFPPGEGLRGTRRAAAGGRSCGRRGRRCGMQGTVERLPAAQRADSSGYQGRCGRMRCQASVRRDSSCSSLLA